MEKPEDKSVGKDGFSGSLRAWFSQYGRDLPWRGSRSLYHVVVSEFMLQQTQVATVIPYFERWMARWPDFESLAAEEETEVVKQWEGLGYYTRARNLLKLAKEIVQLEEIPCSAVEWLRFPGVGPYASAAITSIAFGHPAAVVDGNVVRILTRLKGDETEYRDSASAAKALAPAAQELISNEAPGEHNEAMMELGATVCVRRRPSCTICPVLRFCAAGRRGDAERLPRLRGKVCETLSVHRAWLYSGGRLLLHRRTKDSRRLADFHELPTIKDLGGRLPANAVLLQRKRGISNQRITETIYRVRGSKARLARVEESDSLVWVELDELESVMISGPHRRWIKEIIGMSQA